MPNTQENKINTKEFGYAAYNKLNIFMTILLLCFSISFAILGYRVKPEAMWWGIFLLVLPLFTLASTSIKNLGAVVVDAVVNNPTIFKIIIVILSLITIVLLAFTVSFWFFLFFVPLLYFILKFVYTFVIHLIQEHPTIFALIIGILSIVGMVYLFIV